MAVLHDKIQAYMAANGFTEKIVKSHAPPKPDTLIAIFSTGGFPSDVDIPFVNPTVQLQCRSKDPPTAWDIAKRAHNLFNRKDDYTLDDIRVLWSFAMGYPTEIGQDEEGRLIVVVNLRFKLEDII